MKKEYGKLTSDQFRGFVDQLPLFQSMAEEMRKGMQEMSHEKWDEILIEGYSWAWVTAPYSPREALR